MSRRLRRIVPTIVAGAVLVGACGSDPDDPAAAPAIEGVVVEDGQTNAHVGPPYTFDSAPPSGGDHAPVWLDCGVYDVPVPNGNAVHSLEHGVVWFAHDPALTPDEVDTLVALQDAEPDRVIVSPYEGLEAKVVAVAWERRLAVDSVDDPRLVAFLDAYVNGAQAPEPRAACTGGVSQSG